MGFREELQQHFQFTPQVLDQELKDYACVAIILRGSDENSLELGYIRRALREEDRWSGQIAFPGGRSETFDASDLASALRETREEIGVELSPQEQIGRLNDIQGRRKGLMLDFFIRPFVFYIERNPSVQLDPREVADFFWFPLSELQNPQRQTEYVVRQNNLTAHLPAVRVGEDPPLWGLTYMMTQELLQILKRKKP
jgi:8-oxo-dGTP pyrophosphatase MutT (NUDIX family)